MRAFTRLLHMEASHSAQVNLVSPRLGGPNQATPPLSPTQAGLLLHAAASGMTPHHTWAQQQQQYQPTSPSAGHSLLPARPSTSCFHIADTESPIGK